MRSNPPPFLIGRMFMHHCKMAGAQDAKSSVDSIIDLPSSYISKVGHKYAALERIIQKGLSLLNKLLAFTQFMKQYGESASLFRLSDNYFTPQNLAGLQTRAQVQQQIQNQLASGGPNAQ
jgi:hypothetical protein